MRMLLLCLLYLTSVVQAHGEWRQCSGDGPDVTLVASKLLIQVVSVAECVGVSVTDRGYRYAIPPLWFCNGVSDCFVTD